MRRYVTQQGVDVGSRRRRGKTLRRKSKYRMLLASITTYELIRSWEVEGCHLPL